jgi:hypothetical protein
MLTDELPELAELRAFVRGELSENAASQAWEGWRAAVADFMQVEGVDRATATQAAGVVMSLLNDVRYGF